MTGVCVCVYYKLQLHCVLYIKFTAETDDRKREREEITSTVYSAKERAVSSSSIPVLIARHSVDDSNQA